MDGRRKRRSATTTKLYSGGTTTTGSSSKRKRPAWATLVVPPNPEPPTETNTQQSEALWRTDRALAAHQRIGRAHNDAWREVVERMLSEPQPPATATTASPRHQSRPPSKPHDKDHDKKYHASKRQRLLEHYTIEPSSDDPYHDVVSDHDEHSEPTDTYPWDLLPVTVVANPPFCRLDRGALTEAIVDYYRRRHRGDRRRKPCVVVLPRLLPTLSGAWQLLARQLARYGEEDPLLKVLLGSSGSSSNKKHRSALAEALLVWAAHTVVFGSLIVVLGDPGGHALRGVRRRFWEALGEWRRDAGLPVSVVVVGVPSAAKGSPKEGAFPDPAGACHGLVRLRARSLDTRAWGDAFWASLRKDGGGSPAWERRGPVAARAHAAYLEDGSACSYADTLQRAAAGFFAVPGSFVWDALSPSAGPAEAGFLAWFASYATAKKWLSPAPGAAKLAKFRECSRIRAQHDWWWEWEAGLLGPLLPWWTTTPSQRHGAADWSELLSRLAGLRATIAGPASPGAAHHGNDILERYLDRPGRHRRRQQQQPTEEPPPATATTAQEDGTAAVPPGATTHPTDDGREEEQELSAEQTKATTLLYELIVLVGSRTDPVEGEEDGTSSTGRGETTDTDAVVIETGIAQMLWELHDLVAASMDGLLEQWKRTNPLYKARDTEEDPPERDHALHLEHRREIVGGLTSPAKELYALLADRFAIAREDWLYESGGSPETFTRGVWTLVLAGLVRVKPRKGGGLLYEKVGVVWCS